MHDAEARGLVDPATTLRKRLPDGNFSDLVNEALTSRLEAERIVSDRCDLDTDGAVNGRGSCYICGPRKSLNSFHTGLGLEIANEFAGNQGEVVPTRTSYLYYDNGDYSFFHHDAVHAHITVIVGLSDDLLPLALYPDFGHVSEADVATLNGIKDTERAALARRMVEAFGRRGECREVDVLNRHALAIRGRRVPHARPLQPAAGVVCTACYSFVIPPKDWQVP